MRNRLTPVLALLVGLAACQADDPTPTGVAPTSAAAVQEDLFTLAPNAALNSAQQGLLTAIRNRPSSAEVHVARVATAPGRLLQQGRALRVSVAPGRQVVALGERVEQRAASDVSWTGSVQGEQGTVQMVLTSAGVTATVRTGAALYRIEPLGAGLHAITRVDQTRLPPDHAPDHPTGAAEFTAPAPQPSPFAPAGAYSASLTANTRIDVLVVYTAAAASVSGDIGGLIQLAIDETNQSYANSGISITLSKAHVAQVSYNESNRSFLQHVNALQSTTDGLMDNVHALRDTYLADVVVLVVNDDEACGRAAAIKATAHSAFAAAHYNCITGNYSFGHEIGHLQGARHDRFVDNSSSPYAYGHGFIPSTKNWRTIMAYGDNCGGCTRVQWWSNPYVTYPFTGQAMGTTSYENNARVLNTTAATVAAFRSPYSVSISGPEFVFSEGPNTWTATFTGNPGTHYTEWRINWLGDYSDEFVPIDTGDSLTLNISSCDPDFELMVLVSSPTQGPNQDQVFVFNMSSGSFCY